MLETYNCMLRAYNFNYNTFVIIIKGRLNLKNMFDKILEFLSGKKTSIATIIAAILVFGQGRGWIPNDVADLIVAILVGLGITLNIATSRYYAKKNSAKIPQ